MTFSLDGRYGRLKDFLESEKSYWSEEHNKESKEEFERAVEENHRDMLPWDDRTTFDQYTVDILNRHFSLDVLAQAAMHPELPDHMRGRLILTVWTRASLLGRSDIASKIAVEASR